MKRPLLLIALLSACSSTPTNPFMDDLYDAKNSSEAIDTCAGDYNLDLPFEKEFQLRVRCFQEVYYRFPKSVKDEAWSAWSESYMMFFRSLQPLQKSLTDQVFMSVNNSQNILTELRFVTSGLKSKDPIHYTKEEIIRISRYFKNYAEYIKSR